MNKPTEMDAGGFRSKAKVPAKVGEGVDVLVSGGGYVFGTSNCIYSGMALDRYELMLNIWRKEGIYKKAGTGQP